jgi:nicotinamidase/pyrazinamidase
MRGDRFVFVDVDTQVDFLDPAGRLYVPGAEEIIPALDELFTLAEMHHIPVLSTVDAHTPDDPEFADWPPHCVIGTPGQQKVPQTVLPSAITLERTDSPPANWHHFLEQCNQVILPKPTLDAFDNPHFAAAAESLRARSFIVFGVATDYCVLIAARGLLRRGCRVSIVEDAIRPVSPQTGDSACRELAGLGARWITMSQAVGGKA